jgi:hypothetical protein
MKVTEKVLIDICRRANNEQLRFWDSGLKVERRATEYVVLRLFRKAQKGSPSCIDLFHGSTKEIKTYLEGFISAVELVTSIALEK